MWMEEVLHDLIYTTQYLQYSRDRAGFPPSTVSPKFTPYFDRKAQITYHTATWTRGLGCAVMNACGECTIPVEYY